jgi:four helix bundle protein
MIQSYRDLEVWKKSISLIKNVYQLTAAFPKREQYGLTSQIQRSAVSVAANIAEGRSRQSTQEFLYHLNVAYGSLAETETHMFIASELGFLSSAVLEKLLIDSAEIGKMINGLVRSLESKKIPDPRSLTPDPLTPEAA